MDLYDFALAAAIALCLIVTTGLVLVVAGAYHDRTEDQDATQDDPFLASVAEWGDLRDGGRL
jgi:hypothetical protein